jgi:hypothetical protein
MNRQQYEDRASTINVWLSVAISTALTGCGFAVWTVLVDDANALIGAFLLVLVWFGTLFYTFYRLETRWMKRHAGHCMNCGYNLYGLRSARCPEGGAEIDRDSMGREDSGLP